MRHSRFALLPVILVASFSFGREFTITVMLKHEATNARNARYCYIVGGDSLRCLNEDNNATILVAKGSDGNIYTLISQSVGTRLDYTQPGAVLPAKVHRSKMAVTVTRLNGKRSTSHFLISAVKASDAQTQ